MTNIANNQLSGAMVRLADLQTCRLATMKRINAAADDAAGLAIMEKMESQILGFDKGADNIQSIPETISFAKTNETDEIITANRRAMDDIKTGRVYTTDEVKTRIRKIANLQWQS